MLPTWRVRFPGSDPDYEPFGLAWLKGLTWGRIGLVAAIGLMEVPALLVKWIQLHRAGLLRLGYEMLFLSAGAAGILIGAVANWLLIGSLG